MLFTISNTLDLLLVNSFVISNDGRKSVVNAVTAAFWVIEQVPLVNCPCNFLNTYTNAANSSLQ